MITGDEESSVNTDYAHSLPSQAWMNHPEWPPTRACSYLMITLCYCDHIYFDYSISEHSVLTEHNIFILPFSIQYPYGEECTFTIIKAEKQKIPMITRFNKFPWQWGEVFYILLYWYVIESFLYRGLSSFLEVNLEQWKNGFKSSGLPRARLLLNYKTRLGNQFVFSIN